MCRQTSVDLYDDDIDVAIESSPSTSILRKRQMRELRRLILHPYYRLHWSIEKVLRVCLSVGTPSRKVKYSIILAIFLASLWRVAGTSMKRRSLRALSWTYKHSSCFTSEAATASWSVPKTIPRTCPSIPDTKMDNSMHPSPPSNRICLVSLTDGAAKKAIAQHFSLQSLWQRLTRCRNFDAITDLVRTNHAQYAARHGYRYTMVTNGSVDSTKQPLIDPRRPPAWSKIRAVQAQFQSGQCDWVMWLDADVVVMNPTIRIEETIDSFFADLIATPDKSFGVSSGVWLMRHSDWSMQFLEEWWNSKKFVRQRGLSLSGDNAAFGNLVQQRRHDREDDHIRVTPHRCTMNSNGLFVNSKGIDVGTKRSDWRGSTDFYHMGDFLAHASGIDRKDLAVRYLLQNAAAQTQNIYA